jgi:hypothetical protein
MIYTLKNGSKIDTATQLSFDERNFLQKMMIYQHLGISLQKFQERWRQSGNPIWQGPDTLTSGRPLVSILLDIEETLGLGHDE